MYMVDNWAHARNLPRISDIKIGGCTIVWSLSVFSYTAESQKGLWIRFVKNKTVKLYNLRHISNK